MKIVCLGDSVTYGLGVERDQAWTALAAEKTGWAIVNAGDIWDTTGGMLARFTRDVRQEKPDAVFIMGGGNDFVAGCPAYVMQSNIMAIAQQSLCSGIRAVVGIPTPVVRSMLPEEWKPLWRTAAPETEYRKYVAWLPVFTKGCFGLIDMETPLLEAAQKEPEKTFLDGIHPTPATHRRIAELFIRGMRGILNA